MPYTLFPIKSSLLALSVLFAMFIAVPMFGQSNITKLEYFIDIDPGFGLATDIPISANTQIDINTIVEATSVSAGFHNVTVRAQNATGVWGFGEKRQFYIAANNSSVDPPVAQITKLEYFIDVDPGFGLATTIPISTGHLVDINYILEASTVTAGFHNLTVRTQNADGVWGFGEKRQFYISANNSSVDPPVAQVTKLEYFIDVDPGFGLANDIPISTGDLIDINYIVEASVIPTGFHMLNVRAQNAEGRWSMGEKRQFYIVEATSTVDPPPSDITALEYFFDVDPGFGQANSLSISAGQLVDITPLIPETLSAGHHFIHIRAKNADGRWGLSEKRPVYIAAPVAPEGSISDIDKIEYFFDGNDPGIGLATDFPVTSGPLIDLDPALLATPLTLIDGTHEITIRARNVDGRWGMAETTTFDVLDDCTQPIAAFTPIINCAGQVITFTDNSTSIQGDATYRWYLNGDAIIDDTTVGDATFTYNIPGTYVVALAIRQGTICLDSIATTIDVQPQPIAVFSTSGTEVNQPTIFTPSAVNLPPSVTWEWDFDGDLIVDDNTVGSISHTYSSEATFNPILTITDGLGCEVTVTNPVIITNGSTTSPDPTTDFLAENGCVGNNIIFSDLSQNIPVGATYSWDFDGDGNEDSSTAGNQNFTFLVSGSFDATLIVDLGTSTIETVHIIEIVNMPVVNFSTVGNNVNQPTSFSTTTSNLETGAVWEWDFDANLVVDDNTAGNTSYTYISVGVYNPNLKINNGYGCITTVTNPILIIGDEVTPVINFLANNGCVNSTTSFIDLSQNIPANATYSWDFNGDGIEDSNTIGNQSYSYSTPGLFEAKLIIDIGGTTIEYTQTVEIVDVPIPKFSTTDVCEGSIMSFTDESSFSNSNSIYSWDFDNDAIIDSNAKTGVEYAYTTNGSHLVKLSISNGFGCSQEIVSQVNVIGLPSPEFDWDVVCTGELVSFNDLSVGVETNATYSWDLDGDAIEDFNTHGDVEFTFTSNGIYNVSLTISNLQNCETTTSKVIEIIDRPEVAIDVIAKCYGQESQMVDLSQKISPTAIYSWDFENDGTIDDNTIGTTAFTYTSYNSYVVNLTVDNGGGCSSSVDKLVVFSDAASPDFMVNKTCEGEEVVFTDLSTNLETGATYSWDFDGDGNEDAATPGSATNTFYTQGNHNTTLTIDNGGQCLAYKTIALDITPPPAVSLGADLNLCEAGVVTFDAGTGYASYLWPDGSNAQTFTVDQIGDYMVKVQDAKGCFNTDTISVNLLGPPIPLFDHYIELSLEGIKVHFSNTTTNGDTYAWSFGDGATSDEADPSHIYSDFSFFETSVYEVCLTSTNSCEVAQFCESIFVSPTQFMEEGSEAINVFPNPVSSLLTLEVDQSKLTVNEMGIINTQGQLLWASEAGKSNYQINMEDFKSGTYFLMLQQKDKIIYKRIVKQ